jgi:hypothetical protein
LESDVRVSKVRSVQRSGAGASADFRATATEHEIVNQPERSQSQQSRIRSTGQEAVIILDACWGGGVLAVGLDSRGLCGLCLLFYSAEIPVLGAAIGDLELVKDNRAAALKRERMPERPSQHRGA